MIGLSATLPACVDAVQRTERAFRAARAARRRATLLAGAILLACLFLSAWMSEVRLETLAAGIPRIGEYFGRILPTLRWEVLFADWETEGSLAAWFYRADKWALLIFETAQMALLGTLGGGAVALGLCFFAARNLAPGGTAYHLARRTLEFCRTVPEIVFALIFVWAFGVGALAGILAIALHTAGALGKQFAEVAENADPGPPEAVRSTGAGWIHQMRFGVLPKVLPNFLSYALLRFEINLRGASVIGFVGAGGIGEELYHVIAFNYYEEISAIIVMIILSVMAIDILSERLRHRLILGAAQGPARSRSARIQAFLAVAAIGWVAALFWWFGITPQRLWNGLSGLGTILVLMVPPSPGELWLDILKGLAESVAMAFLGTFVAALIAVPLGFLGAGNVLTNTLARLSLRRVFDGFRGVDQLIWALAYVRAVGLGPLAGVLAIATADIAVLAKLYAEAIENAERRQAEAVDAAGGRRVHRIRFGLLPQVLPVMLSQALYFFESNTRSAAILGVVGAGGIGLQIAERIRVRHWDEVAFIILLMIATVAAIDWLSARMRLRLIGRCEGSVAG